ncbi:MAG: FAD-dependent oxidoreductase, partial [Atopobiaceae bacterium]|nr:FAD-dependent oxidoreductase [Atopobiaceae bacterium]
MKRYDLIVIGAGPAGLSCALEAASHGVEVAVFDENERPGGQLIKQIHKFFGSKEHRAKERGFNIGREMLEEVEKAGVKVHLNAPVLGLYDAMEIQVNENGTNEHYKADSIVVAAGAQENMIPFEGWTLPGVMGAGAAQTLMNLHGV